MSFYLLAEADSYHRQNNHIIDSSHFENTTHDLSFPYFGLYSPLQKQYFWVILFFFWKKSERNTEQTMIEFRYDSKGGEDYDRYMMMGCEMLMISDWGYAWWCSWVAQSEDVLWYDYELVATVVVVSLVNELFI